METSERRRWSSRLRTARYRRMSLPSSSGSRDIAAGRIHDSDRWSQTADNSSRAKLNASLALLPVDRTQLPYLEEHCSTPPRPKSPCCAML